MTESVSKLTAKSHADHLLKEFEHLLKDNPNKQGLLKAYELDLAFIIALAMNEGLKKAHEIIEDSGIGKTNG